MTRKRQSPIICARECVVASFPFLHTGDSRFVSPGEGWVSDRYPASISRTQRRDQERLTTAAYQRMYSAGPWPLMSKKSTPRTRVRDARSVPTVSGVPLWPNRVPIHQAWTRAVFYPLFLSIHEWQSTPGEGQARLRLHRGVLRLLPIARKARLSKDTPRPPSSRLCYRH